ncbi:hypothetical protein Patl1_02591 [Pistacia atlantica]|uniref:Uncharacterized protein n=1 Tax=Pistacia atlantica TaxID=434234 RepID=A0ACC1C5T7_9ROSI|nr:hypothetical protein Patl1_02591 [Pistacia atlantica]
MADFGYLSDTDDSAVEDLISQAKDLSVLEQVSAINCSGFTDSVLPSELEQRFRKLKSFPATNAKPKSSGEKSLQRSKSELNDSRGECEQEQSRDGKMGLEKKSELGYDSLTENEIFSDWKYFKEKSKRGSDSAPFSSKSFSSPLSCTNSSRGSPSPPRKSGCFWCSPKKNIQPKSKEDRSVMCKNDEFLSDLGIFSVKEQQKMLKKAMKEEEKVSREAEKIVKWAKQASMRMSAHDIEDELSDD